MMNCLSPLETRAIATSGSPTPTLETWNQLWDLWNAATTHMCRDPSARPLELRQPFIFYLGHIPAFADARVAKVTQQQLTEPAHYAAMFARGIDPDLDDPTQCHSHSPTPAQWPTVSDILSYRDRVRARITQLYSPKPLPSDAAAAAATDEASAIAAMPEALQHVLWMSYEHEAMHLETLLYMLVQYEAVQPPPTRLVRPTPAAAWCSSAAAGALDAAAAAAPSDAATAFNNAAGGGRLSGKAAAGPAGGNRSPCELLQLLLPMPPEASWIPLQAREVTLGFTAAQHSSDRTADATTSTTITSSTGHSSGRAPCCGFGWDNESPARGVLVSAVEMQHRPVTVLEYLHYVSSQLASGLTHASSFQVHEAAGVEGPTRACQPEPWQQHSSSCDGCSHGNGNGMTALSHSSSSNATTLPELLLASQQMQPGVCAGCKQSVLLLLHNNPAAAHLLPASLVVVGADTSTSSSSSGFAAEDRSSSTATSGQSRHRQDSCSGSCLCFGLCELLLLLLGNGHTAGGPCSATPADPPPAAAAQGAFSCKHQLGPQPALQAAVFASLQLLCGVKTVFGCVPLNVAAYWPLYCSALQAERYAAWYSSSGGAGSPYRLPTEAEVLSARQHNKILAASTAGGCSSMAQSTGGQDRRSTGATLAAGSTEGQSAAEAVLAVEGVGFATWHPLCVPLQPAGVFRARQCHPVAWRTRLRAAAATTGCAQLVGQTAPITPGLTEQVSQLDGNGWEWTGTIFGEHDGFQAHPLYPEYSQDFFGGKHVVLLGGSWATLKSLSDRSTLRNWYLKGQQHVFAKFRLCRDVQA